MHCTDIFIMKSVCITYIPAAFSRLLSDSCVTLHICALSKIHGFRQKLQVCQVHVLKYSSIGKYSIISLHNWGKPTGI